MRIALFALVLTVLSGGAYALCFLCKDQCRVATKAWLSAGLSRV
jgi:hypothetical protein